MLTDRKAFDDDNDVIRQKNLTYSIQHDKKARPPLLHPTIHPRQVAHILGLPPLLPLLALTLATSASKTTTKA